MTDTWRELTAEPDKFLVDCLQQAASGLACMHAKNYIHHDIKPENLALVSASPPTIAIIDLGSAENKPTYTNHMLGTLRYLAPEVWTVKAGPSSDQPFGCGVDVWALGRTLFELLVSHRSPEEYGKAENRDLLHQLLTHGPRSAELDHFWSLASKMLERDPAQRVSAADVEKHLEAQIPDVDPSRDKDQLAEQSLRKRPRLEQKAVPRKARSMYCTSSGLRRILGTITGEEATAVQDAGQRWTSMSSTRIIITRSPAVLTFSHLISLQPERCS